MNMSVSKVKDRMEHTDTNQNLDFHSRNKYDKNIVVVRIKQRQSQTNKDSLKSKKDKSQYNQVSIVYCFSIETKETKKDQDKLKKNKKKKATRQSSTESLTKKHFYADAFRHERDYTKSMSHNLIGNRDTKIVESNPVQIIQRKTNYLNKNGSILLNTMNMDIFEKSHAYKKYLTEKVSRHQDAKVEQDLSHLEYPEQKIKSEQKETTVGVQNLFYSPNVVDMKEHSDPLDWITYSSTNTVCSAADKPSCKTTTLLSNAQGALDDIYLRSIEKSPRHERGIKKQSNIEGFGNKCNIGKNSLGENEITNGQNCVQKSFTHECGKNIQKETASLSLAGKSSFEIMNERNEYISENYYDILKDNGDMDVQNSECCQEAKRADQNSRFRFRIVKNVGSRLNLNMSLRSNSKGNDENEYDVDSGDNGSTIYDSILKDIQKIFFDENEEISSNIESNDTGNIVKIQSYAFYPGNPNIDDDKKLNHFLCIPYHENIMSYENLLENIWDNTEYKRGTNYLENHSSSLHHIIDEWSGKRISEESNMDMYKERNRLDMFAHQDCESVKKKKLIWISPSASAAAAAAAAAAAEVSSTDTSGFEESVTYDRNREILELPLNYVGPENTGENYYFVNGKYPGHLNSGLTNFHQYDLSMNPKTTIDQYTYSSWTTDHASMLTKDIYFQRMLQQPEGEGYINPVKIKPILSKKKKNNVTDTGANNSPNCSSIESEKKSYCINCGKYGHLFKKCNFPILSFGLIGYHYDSHLDQISFIMIQSKNTFHFLDFIRGKYDLMDCNSIKKLFMNMTTTEINMIGCKNFETIWKETYHDIYVLNEIQENQKKISKTKYEYLMIGYHIDNVFYDLDYFLTLNPNSNIEISWSFPKGRRNYKESDLMCAIREFEEETGLKRKFFEIKEPKKIYCETYMGDNNIEYQHRYFLAEFHQKIFLEINQMNSHQVIEIGTLKWLTKEEAIRNINPIYKQRIEIVNQFVDDILENKKRFHHRKNNINFSSPRPSFSSKSIVIDKNPSTSSTISAMEGKTSATNLEFIYFVDGKSKTDHGNKVGDNQNKKEFLDIDVDDGRSSNNNNINTNSKSNIYQIDSKTKSRK